MSPSVDVSVNKGIINVNEVEVLDAMKWSPTKSRNVTSQKSLKNGPVKGFLLPSLRDQITICHIHLASIVSMLYLGTTGPSMTSSI